MTTQKNSISNAISENGAGDLWGITTYFNPAQYKRKLQNYHQFRTASKKQGLPLIVVELAFGEHKFELTKDDAEIVIQRRCNTVLWQKERLLNIALEFLRQTIFSFSLYKLFRNRVSKVFLNQRFFLQKF